MRLLLAGALIMSFLFGCTAKSIDDQARALGSKEFSTEGWARATQELRGEMVASLLEKHRPTSLSAKEVIRLLGPPTGYYEYDEYPAYFVGPKSVQSKYGSGYVLAFVTDKGTGRVIKVLLLPEVGS